MSFQINFSDLPHVYYCKPQDSMCSVVYPFELRTPYNQVIGEGVHKETFDLKSFSYVFSSRGQTPVPKASHYDFLMEIKRIGLEILSKFSLIEEKGSSNLSNRKIYITKRLPGLSFAHKQILFANIFSLATNCDLYLQTK